MIEVFGINKTENFNCPGCSYFKKLCEENSIEYEFNDVTKFDNKLGTNVLDRDKIVKLAGRAKFRTLRITYPVIFDGNDTPLTLKEFMLKYDLY